MSDTQATRRDFLIVGTKILMVTAATRAALTHVIAGTPEQVATYKAADMSFAYPVMRGSAPLLVGLAGVPLFGEYLSLTAWLAILIISGGIFSMGFVRHDHGTRGLLLALATAMMIALCTLIDAEGVRRGPGRLQGAYRRPGETAQGVRLTR